MNIDNSNLIANSAFFSEIDQSFFPEHRSLQQIVAQDCVTKQFKKNDIIIREGDYGTSAFVIIKGSAWYVHDEIDLGNKQIKIKKNGLTFLFELLKIKYPFKHQAEYSNIKKSDQALAEIKKTLLIAGDVFGETSGRDPRAATVIANENCEIIEIKWQGVRDLRKYSPEICELFDSLYRSRSFEKTIKKNKLFQNLNETDINYIIQNATLESKGRIDGEEVDPDIEKEISSIGRYVNGLIIIRSGFAKVCDRDGHTIKYLSRGDSFGLTEIYSNWKNQTHQSYQFSLSYLGYLETIFIPKNVVENIILPKLTSFESEFSIAENLPDSVFLNFTVTNRLNNGRSLMMIDLERCTRCNDCVDACAITHNNIPRFKRDGKKHGKYQIAKSCMHCLEPYCMNDCPTGAIYRDELNGEVVVNEDTCIGCSNCAENCIYDNIEMLLIDNKPLNTEGNIPKLKASKCDLCIEFSAGPACERACPTDALKRINLSDFNSFVKWTEEN